MTVVNLLNIIIQLTIVWNFSFFLINRTRIMAKNLPRIEFLINFAYNDTCKQLSHYIRCITSCLYLLKITIGSKQILRHCSTLCINFRIGRASDVTQFLTRRETKWAKHIHSYSLIRLSDSMTIHELIQKESYIKSCPYIWSFILWMK